MRAFTLRRSDIDRCPKHSWEPGHYLDDGTCGCLIDPIPAQQEHAEALRAWIAARGDDIAPAHARLVAAREGWRHAQEHLRMPW